MANFSSIRDKLTPAIGGIIVLYLAVLAIFTFKLLPTRSEISRLEIKLSDQKRHERNLLGIIEGRPALEKEQQRLEERIANLAEKIPTQYDLPEVLDTLEQLAKSFGVELDSLEHTPLRTGAANFHGTVPLYLGAAGGEAIFSYLCRMQDLFPSLHIAEAVLQYAGSNRFQMSVRASLQVLIAKDAAASNWRRPGLQAAELAGIRSNAFGLPFKTVERFLTGQVKVLGVVEAGGEFDALITKDGEKRWVKAGDFLGDAVIKEISAQGVFLDVDGVDIRLTIGG